ncbi:MAG: hypothetical protein Phog2KO_00530 [Phototrophicaceae bacterium]
MSVVLVSAQAGQCTEIIETALANAEEECSGIGRNQACFGHIALDATGQPDANNFDFSNLGDVVDVASIQTLELGGYNSETGAWGVVLMRLQANLPNTLPGQNVTIVLFGDTVLRNAASSVTEQIPPEQQQTITASGSVNIRALPSTTARVLDSISNGAEITATGRTADNQWVRVLFNEQTGWVASFLLGGNEDINNLLAIDPEAAQYGPMQAFYLSTGIGRSSCNEVPDDGMVVQTPEGVGTINLAINEIEVEMGSTVYFSLDDERMLSIAPVEGAARVSSNGTTHTAIAGTQINIQLDEDYIADGDPSMPESYLGDEYIEFLPYDVLEREIEWDDGLSEEEYEDFLEYEEIFDNLELEDLDEFFDYVEEFQDEDDFNVLGFIIDELDYTEFDDEFEDYFESEGYDFGDYDTYTGDDSYYYYDSDDGYDGSDSDDGYYDDSGYDDSSSDDGYYDDSGGYDDSSYDDSSYDDSYYDDSGGYDDGSYDDY